MVQGDLLHPFLVDEELICVQDDQKEKAARQDHTSQADDTFAGPAAAWAQFPSRADSCTSGGDYEAETRNVVHSRGSVTKDRYRSWLLVYPRGNKLKFQGCAHLRKRPVFSGILETVSSPSLGCFSYLAPALSGFRAPPPLTAP